MVALLPGSRSERAIGCNNRRLQRAATAEMDRARAVDRFAGMLLRGGAPPEWLGVVRCETRDRPERRQGGGEVDGPWPAGGQVEGDPAG